MENKSRGKHRRGHTQDGAMSQENSPEDRVLATVTPRVTAYSRNG